MTPALRTRLSALVPPLLRREAESVPGEAVAFASYAAGVTRQLAILGCLLMIAATALWWPLDRVVFDDPMWVDAFAALRRRALVIEAAGLLLFATLRVHALWTPALAVATYSALMASFGYSLGVLGDDALPLMADALFGVVPSVLIPLTFRARCASVTAIAAAYAGAWLVARPDNLTAPGTPAQLSFLVFVSLFALVAGDVLTRILYRAWAERRALDHANAQLAELTDTLSERVAERTRRLGELTRHMDATQETERQRIAHDLHDDMGQQLTAMRYTLVRLGHQLQDAPDATADLLADLDASLDATTGSVRSVVTRLRPRILDDLGLAPSLEWLCDDIARRAHIPCTLEVATSVPGTDLDDATALVLFRAVQETTTNALKHAAPSCLRVGLDLTPDAVRVTIADDGAGFDVDAHTSGLGLFALRERVDASGGTLELTSAPGAGTTVTVSLPLRARSTGGPT